MRKPPAAPAASDLDALTPEQRALLMLRLRRQGQSSPERAGGDPAAALPRVPRDRPLPLSFGQRRLWLADRRQPGSPAYNVPFAFRLQGRLDGDALDAAFAGIVRRHESLRTRFVEEGGEPLQVIEPPRPVPVPRVDLSRLPEEARLDEARRLAAETARHPFDLERGPLLRLHVLELGPDDHALLTVVHHIASDAWSVGLFVREFIALYRAHLERRPASLSELPIQYADFAVWQRESRAAELAAQVGFWQERLSGAPSLDLPADRPRPAALSGRGVQTHRWWTRRALEGLQAFARRRGVTVFMALLAVFQTLLARHAGQDDVSVGTPVAGRGRAELEPLIGFFVNTLVLRADLSGDPAFAALLARVRKATLEAFAHQDVPFEQVVKAVRPGGEPLFQVMFNFQSDPGAPREVPGLQLSRLVFAAGVSMFDLTLDCREIGGALLVEAEYSTDLFEAPTVERLLDRLEVLLAAALDDPGQTLSELPLLSAAERHAVLTGWNDTLEIPDNDAEGFIHRQFAEQARQTPDAPALVFGEEGEGTWTYDELRRRAAGLARCLRGLGVGPEVRVGICAGRTPERIASVLAVLEAGGAFVPLDPDDPPGRLALIVQDVRPAVVLAEERFRNRLPEGVRFVPVEQDWSGPPGAVVPPPLGGWAVGSGGGQEGGFSRSLSPDNAAYVIYTSGSTGRPKGVVVPHRGIAHAARAWEEEYGLRRNVRSLLQVAGFSFDVFVGDLARALTTGSRLVLAPAEALIDPALLSGWIARQRIDLVDLVPAVARALVEHLEAADAALDLAVLSVGADAWPVQDMERAARRVAPRTRLVNSYGLTEASVDSSLCDCPLDRPFAGPVVPIGRPFPGTRLLVLDTALRPVPIGVAGELCAGGPGLARGYLGRPDLTAARFVPDPFTVGGRLYRTGDRARFLPDGVVELLGRFDHQIKVRGVRIEPAEVEAALTGQPGVAQAVVVATGQGRARRLVAFVVAGPAPPPSYAELRAALRQRLPEALVPAAFEILDGLPLTANGKVDRGALAARAAGLGEAVAPEPPAGPLTPVEEIVAGIFAEVLTSGGDAAPSTLGARDDFFELGGHSLLATRVVARLRAVFAVDLPLRRLFELPTVAGLALEIETARRAGSTPARPPLVPLPETARRAGDDLPLSFAQERLWFLEQLFPALYHMPLMARLAGPLDAAALARSLAAVVARHEILRTAYPAVEGRPVQRVVSTAGPVLPRIDLDDLPVAHREAAARAWVAEVSVRPFDLEAAPPWRALLLRLGPEDHVLALVLHHIAADGWSLEVLTRDLAGFYAGTPAPEPAVQYADFALWQRGWLRDEALDEQLRYWRERLAGLPPALALPFDRPRPAVPSGRGAVRGFTLPGLAGPLRRLARQAGATLFMALLAGVEALLARLSGQTDVAVGTAVAGREPVETEGVVGLFVNTLVLRCDLADDPAFLPALLPRAREAALGAYAHQALPFERLVEELQPERVLAYTPLFQVMLALQNTPTAGLSLPGLSAAPAPAERRAAAFELGLQLFELGEDLAGAAEYATDLFDAATVDRTLGHLAALLAGAVERLEARVSELPLLAAAERHQLEMEWSGAGGEAARLPPVHHAFAARARQTPEATALSWLGGALTYGELDRRAARLASRLRQGGLVPGGRVALLLERSPDFAVAQLAVWKAGGVAVPLDPAWPRDRLERLREESGAVLVLTETLAPHPLAPSPIPSHPYRERGNPEAAYILYTSGSTGRPKGVMVEHGSLSFTLAAAQEVIGWDAADVTSWSAAPTFDISLLELWAPLLAGGICAVLPAGPGADLAAWRELLPRLTRLHAVPGLMRPLADLARDEALPCGGLRTVLTGGEAVPAELLADLRRTFPGATLGVLYGPTEATIIATSWKVEPGEEPVRSLLGRPLGRPLPGVEIQVRDAAGRTVPANVAGEIWIGGSGVAHGYLDRERETAERFIEQDGRRFYRTGDLGRWTPAGDLEFRGRADDQVKIRGIRIEPGEVEAALAAAPGVREAAVAVRDDLPGGRGLVAYVVGEEPAGDLRAFLADRLPAYMVPAAFVLLDELPRTPHGKVDRRALPAPEAPGEDPGRVAPRTPLESLLAALWREVIGGEGEVGVHDNFFDLGGDSIKGAILTNRLGRVLGEHVPVALLFESPTVAGLAAALEAEYPAAVVPSPPGPLSHPLPPTGRGGSQKDSEGVPLSRRSGGDGRGDGGEGSLSFAQERLWFLQRLDPRSATYNMGDALVLRGRLDTAALAAAWREILRRHETLRTRFELRDGLPVAQVEPVPDTPLARIDLSGLGTVAIGAAHRLAREEAARPFDLRQGPVVRGLLLLLGPDAHVLLFTTHHIACDAWSLGLWAREIQVLYTAFAVGGPPLPEPPVQYGDFATWQRSWLQGDRLAAQLAYWREHLRGAPSQLELPLDHPRPAFQTHRGAAAALSLAPELADRLRALSSRHGASLFMTLLAAFALQMSRLSSQDDILVGSPIAGRTRPEVEGLIGCFLNTLVLRADLSGDPSFRDLLGRVRDTALGAFSHQDVPFEKVLEELRPERDTSRPPLFQVLFNLANVPRSAMELPGLTLEPLGPGEPAANFDLTLYIAEEDGLALHLVYNADLFAAPRMEEMLRQYRLLLAQAAERPDVPVSAFTLLTPKAAAVLPDPVESLDHPWPGAVHDLFAAQARRAPDRIALTDRDGSWTYSELNRAVDHLAARLRGDGIAAGDVVAVWAHRGAALAWALLGIARAGAAFTLLDPAYPAPRLVDRLRMAPPRVLLQIDAAGPLPPELATFTAAQGYPCRMVLRAPHPVAPSPIPSPQPGEGEGRRGREGAPLSRRQGGEGRGDGGGGPHDIACIAFTSGSTGLPKGIVQTHGSMSYFLPWHQEVLGYTEADRHTMLSGLAHDPLQRDIFYGLATGATLCVPDPDRIGEPGYLADWMAEQRVTVTNLTPAMALLLTELPPGKTARLPDLRVTVLGGDLLTRELVERLRALAPRAIFVNVYGTTESHRALSYHFVEETGAHPKQTLPLGRGQTGCQLLVLTPSGGLAGVGELGEVVIRSPYLARGYLGDEALTRARFGPNPFTEDPSSGGDRVYRTGDLGRYLPNGEVEAAGRADQQVKIRGFRVEPGEIEAELLRVPGVKEAVVVAGERGAERELVAYLVPATGLTTLEIPALRERLRRSLPAYMVPAAWVVLPELPLNPNGKIDRLALPAPETREGTKRAAVPPRDELERRLAGIWEEVLGSGPVGVTDDFFDLGGHSLLAVRLMARIEAELGRSLPLSALFQSGTVAGLAARLREAEPAASPLVLLRPGGSRPPFFLVHPAGGEVLCYAELARRLGPDQPVYGLADVVATARSISELAAAYVQAVLAVQPEGPYRLAGWSFGGRVAFEMVRQLTTQGREVAFLGMIDTGRAIPEEGLDLSEMGLLREILRGASRQVLDNLPPGLDDPLGEVVDRLYAAGHIQDAFDPESARRFWQAFRRHVTMARREHPSPWSGRLTFFTAGQDNEEDPTHGWAALAATVEVHRVPGDHVSMIYDAANLDVLARHLREAVHFTPS